MSNKITNNKITNTKYQIRNNSLKNYRIIKELTETLDL